MQLAHSISVISIGASQAVDRESEMLYPLLKVRCRYQQNTQLDAIYSLSMTIACVLGAHNMSVYTHMIGSLRDKLHPNNVA
ncbi:hypothetical protein BABINDRAFT_160491 [Babjeviella inositovora NRRL Y-12698]|uniref:Uncharacterized protein n=1 Tax=Babjeviella inositovora NRRL Y-12698 TaxID=984486 RepID=A0A1E3QTT2_9ASCO|nr:uncharacterized protein BABINDRAFT_160491 [Babjeviella inositovora NRRL Y-12698]ODQ81080.1 hypothetical protein BABINDRAFT_160491 [Babjeviella inositovora NRRL Y-12698]